MMAVAGSAVPKMKRSTVVATIWLVQVIHQISEGLVRWIVLTVVVTDNIQSLDFEKGHHSRTDAQS